MFRIENYIPQQILTESKQLAKLPQPMEFRQNDNKQFMLFADKKAINIKNKFYSLSKLVLIETLRNGIKVVSPDFNRSMLLENIKINLAFEDYAQPYPAFIIQFDERYRQYFKDKYNQTKVPNIAFIHQQAIGYPITISFHYRHFDDVYTSILAPDTIKTTLEEYINALKTDLEEDVSYVKYLERLILNISLLLTHFGATIKHCKPLGRKHRNDEEYQQVEMNYQQVTIREHINRHNDPLGESHRSPHPHWRSGHWRMQAYGENWKLRKRILIDPIFVKFDEFKGDLNDTQVEYK